VAVLKKKIGQELRKRTVESFLDFLILTTLAKNPLMSSDDLMSYIHQKFRISLSSGILYSHLFHVEQDGLILRDYIKNKKVYRLTRKGKQKIDIAKKNKNGIQWVIDQILEG